MKRQRGVSEIDDWSDLTRNSLQFEMDMYVYAKQKLYADYVIHPSIQKKIVYLIPLLSNNVIWKLYMCEKRIYRAKKKKNNQSK